MLENNLKQKQFTSSFGIIVGFIFLVVKYYYT